MKDELKKIEKEDAFFIKNYHLPRINENEWRNIYYYIDTYFIDDNINKEVQYLRYPGFSFSNDEAANYYYNNHYKYLKEKEVYTYPRGNMTRSSNSMIIGIQPGKFYEKYLGASAESAWLIGPSSEMLHSFCNKLNLYSYYTNIYSSRFDKQNYDFRNILNEIKTIKYIKQNIYNENFMVIIFLGSYKEYDSLVRRIEGEGINEDFEIIAYRVWHPSYLLRAYSQEKFNKWVKNILKTRLL
ncbi:MAG: hypothetical protein ACOCQD_02150 [archaeon]